MLDRRGYAAIGGNSPYRAGKWSQINSLEPSVAAPRTDAPETRHRRWSRRPHL